MSELKHEQARYYLHVGNEHLSGVEQESLARHLSECGACKGYATELAALQSTLSRAMHARWDTLAPTPVTDNRIQTRIRRNVVQKQVLNLTSSLASGAVLLGFIVIIVWFFRPPPPVPISTGSASIPTNVNQTFGNTITLLGYDLSQDHLSAGDTLTVTLFWQAPAAPPTSYAVFIHLQDENDKLVMQSDDLPVNGKRPTTTWKPDEVIEDRRGLRLPSSLPSGQYKLTVGLYDPKQGARLSTSKGTDALMLTSVEIR